MSLDSFPPGLLEEWERFAELDKQLPAGQDLYPAIFERGMFPLQRKAEMVEMMKLARSIEPKIVMEIGSDKGGGFYHWVKCLPTVKRAIAVEYRGIPFATAFVNMFRDVDFQFVGASSYDPVTVRKVGEFINNRNNPQYIDCLFIDGSKEHTDRDFKAYLPFMRTGGLVFIHDIEDQSIWPSKFFHTLHENFKTCAILDGREGAQALQRGLRNEPVTSAWEGWLRIWQWTSCGIGVVFV